MIKNDLTLTSYDMGRVVQYLIDIIPSDTWEAIETEIRESKNMWHIDMHFGYGLYVRNLLYKSEIPFPWFELDSYWAVFLETAMRKRRFKKKTAPLKKDFPPVK